MMCGITGILNLSESRPIPAERIGQMLGAIRHRGPDEAGIYLDDRIGLGNVRLSIIDLSGGTQPIHNEDETLWIVFNGEIFNYLELREVLLRKGHRFYTSTDTEVILHLYEEKGEAFLDDLNGQFAFAIWNGKDRRLFIARDRVGILPLYFTVRNGSMFFASEIKALFTQKEVPRVINPIAIDQVFTFWATLGEETAFEGIRALPPGHFLDVSGRSVRLNRYWDIPFFPPSAHLTSSAGEISESVLELLTDSIRIRLRADVPVGCYLSGGLDSSGLTTVVKQNFKNRSKTFGIRFEEDQYDEGLFQDEMVSFLRADHERVIARNEEIGSFFREVLWHCETPLLRTAPVPLYFLSRRVNETGLKVVLTGEGADEVFGGYNIFRETKVRRFWSRQPGSSSRSLLVGRLYPYIFSEKEKKGQYFVRSFFERGLDRVDDPLFSHLLRWENTGRTKAFFSEGLKRALEGYSGYDRIREALPPSYGSWDSLSKAQYLEMSIFMSNYLLSSQGDRVAMANRVEVRPPYLDHRIIELMGRVPSRFKIMGLNEKYILKKSFQGILPEGIRKRPKHPYRAPIHQSLLNPRLDYTRTMLSGDRLRRAGLFDPSKVEKLIGKFQKTGSRNEVENMALAGILSSQILYDQFVENFPGRPLPPVSPDLFVDRRTLKPQ